MTKSDRYRMLVVLISIAGLIPVLSSCGDRKINTGHIHDSAVGGLSWTIDDETGLTGATGDFPYDDSDGKEKTVSFTLGSIQLGSTTAERDLTIVDLVEGASGVKNNSVTNIARLLQTLDDDGDLENGITITEFVSLQATEDLDFDQDPEDFTGDTAVVDFLERVNINALRTAEDAQVHLSETIVALNSSNNSAPVADAGDNQSVNSGDTVELSGTGSDEDGSIERYIWTPDSDNAVTVEVINSISEEGEYSASFTAPEVESSIELAIILKLIDDDGEEGTDEVVITVSP
ncbi:MAG: hypothetical protein KUG82_12050 [Pseudomonadales bacterium]|nr:hypothetical protein [Pseudomonadales bacterium]